MAKFRQQKIDEEMKRELSAHGNTDSVSDAARRYGISRSAYYKYKDAVRPYVGQDATDRMTMQVLLQDCPGVLSGLLSACAKAGANVLTVNQQAPVDGFAAVTLCVQTEGVSLAPDAFAKLMSKVPGLDAVSCGPTLLEIHSSRERADIASIQRTWKYLSSVLAAL